jgi:hypothetical protein
MSQTLPNFADLLVAPMIDKRAGLNHGQLFNWAISACARVL